MSAGSRSPGRWTLAPDPLTPLLAAQPAAPGGGARVELALRAGLGEAPPAGARPSFFHGAIRGFEEVFGLLLQSSALGVVDGMPALPEQLELLGALAGEVPAVRACLGRDLLGRPAVLAELLHEPLGLAL